MKDRVIYVPLGGAGEIGMNAYVYGQGPKGRERLVVVDLGVTFPDMEGSPGVDLIYADLSWLYENRDRVEAIFITHGHEDHIGALGMTWSRIDAPIHCRRFTRDLALRKLKDRGGSGGDVRIVEPFEPVSAAGMEIRFMPVPHSIPEASALILDTAAGRIVHTGDLKLDRDPVIGEGYDPDDWKRIAEPGIQALVCDSTNVFSMHRGRSESSLSPAISSLVADAPGMVVATTFATNLARVKTLAEAGLSAGRSICLLGKTMRDMVGIGTGAGVLEGFPETLAPENAVKLRREKLMLIVTGSQGERRAASAQLSTGKFLGFSMKEGDTFLFSSSAIPGNEVDVARVVNAFSELGVEVVDESGGLYHVSGHANRPDLEEIQGLLDPRMVIPMHGEHRHLREHAKLARDCGRASIVATNGAVIDLSGETPVEVDRVTAGRDYLDGSKRIGARDGVVRDRLRLARNGLVVICLVIDADAEADEVWVETMGLADAGKGRAELGELIEEAVSGSIEGMGRGGRSDDRRVEKEAEKTARKVAWDEIGKKPEVMVLLSRMDAA